LEVQKHEEMKELFKYQIAQLEEKNQSLEFANKQLLESFPRSKISKVKLENFLINGLIYILYFLNN
jgi:hypothetical protein